LESGTDLLYLQELLSITKKNFIQIGIKSLQQVKIPYDG